MLAIRICLKISLKLVVLKERFHENFLALENWVLKLFQFTVSKYGKCNDSVELQSHLYLCFTMLTMAFEHLEVIPIVFCLFSWQADV